VAHVRQELRLGLHGELGPLLGLPQLRIGGLEVARAQRHLLAERAGEAAQAVDPQPVERRRREHDAQRAEPRTRQFDTDAA
jgi:hypothetical protein